MKITNARIALFLMNLGFISIIVFLIHDNNYKLELMESDFEKCDLEEVRRRNIYFTKYLKGLLLIGGSALIFAIRSKIIEKFPNESKLKIEQSQAFSRSIWWNLAMIGTFTYMYFKHSYLTF